MAIALTQPLLQAAFERRRRRDWPETFEAAMTDPYCQALIKLEAFCHARRMQASNAYNKRRDARRATASAPKWSPAFTKPATLDAKRLAAGEREDD